jgi:aryl-alcohol dehydrogenase-like predicted oxidoreductase
MSHLFPTGAALMLMRHFAPTGHETSRLGFGGAAMGLTNYIRPYDAAASRDASVAAVRRALELGVTYCDTAPGYGKGLSEEIMGDALADHPEVFLASKVPLADAADVRRSLENSLKRLRRSQLDLLQIHGNSFGTKTVRGILGAGGMLEQMVRLREEAPDPRIGFTSEDNNRGVYDLIDSGGFDSMQISYNLLLQHPYEPTRPFGSLFVAKERGLFIIAMRAITSGIFQKWVRMVNPADTFEYTDSLLQFVLSNKLIDVALVGMRSTAEVESSCRVWRDLAGRIDVDELWGRYVLGSRQG